MSFTFTKCFTPDGLEFAGLYEVKPEIHNDSRGYFLENYNQKDFFSAGLKMNFVQDNQSFSVKNVLRGLHFQKKAPQGKLIRATQGKILDISVDLRAKSKTFGRYFKILLDSTKKNQIYIPEGFAHGFFVCSENAEISYKCSNFYDPFDEDGILWNDKILDIAWPEKNPEKLILSQKDLNYGPFIPEKKYFDKNGHWIGD